MTKFEPVSGKKNHVLHALRIDEELNNSIVKAIKKLNESGYLEISIPAFIRQALRFYSNQVNGSQVGFSFKEEKNGTN